MCCYALVSPGLIAVLHTVVVSEELHYRTGNSEKKFCIASTIILFATVRQSDMQAQVE